MTQIIESFAEITESCDALFFDVWGCLHDGLRPYPDAVLALQEFINQGGIVILLTNSPRPGRDVARQTDAIGVPRNVWHELVSSGDAAKMALFKGAVGQKIYYVGPIEALGFLEPGEFAEGVKIERTSFEEADGIVCTGLFDDQSDKLEDYRPLLRKAWKRELAMLCANPDVIVDRGHRRVFCAGALAQMYKAYGAEVLLFGKPHPSIYELARKKLHARMPTIDESRIICVGDGITTDVRGAHDQGLRCLFVSGGLAASETGTTRHPDPGKLEEYLSPYGLEPEYAIGGFR